MKRDHTGAVCAVTTRKSVDTSNRQTCCYVYHFVLPSKSRDHVLAEMLPNGVARLPRTELPVEVDYLEPNKENSLERCIEAEIGLSVFLARELWNGFDKKIEVTAGFEINHLYLGDVLDDKPVVMKPYEWIHRDVACMLEWVRTNGEENEDHIAAKLKFVFEEIQEDVSLSKTEPWLKVGWFEQITLWSREELDTKNMVMEERIRQQSRTGQSIVMTCEVSMRGERKFAGKGESHEIIFIKSTLPFIREVERTVAVARVVGSVVPKIIAFKEQEGLLMMRSVGHVTDEAFDQEALIETILKIQRLSMNRISELEAVGLRVRDSEWLESNVESVLNHRLLDDYYGGREPGGDVDEVDKRIVDELRSKAGLIQRKCRDITKLGLPRTIVHGDMHESNIGSPVRFEGKVYRLFDWAKSFIGNPLHDFADLGWTRKGDDVDCRGVSIDLEAGIKQICVQWNVCATLTLEEMRSVFEILGDMSSIIRIHDLTEQYDECDDNDGEANILSELRDWIEGIGERLSD